MTSEDRAVGEWARRVKKVGELESRLDEAKIRYETLSRKCDDLIDDNRRLRARITELIAKSD